ncbi:uncharacterized protein [Antedon mediterranea]|uniref:uncharacterized protein n=1 Tax=Antedon mediterranea TaxID=105859 RepID=UPI003AF55349
MGLCLSKIKVEPGAEDGPTHLSRKQVKEGRKFNRFVRFWRQRSSKVGPMPDSDSETNLSDHASLMSHDERVNEELLRLKNGNSTANIVPTRRLPPIGNQSMPTLRDKSTFQILEELRMSGVIVNPRPGQNGCSFDIVDRATPVLEMPRSLSRLERQTDDESNGKETKLTRKLTAAEERRKEFLLKRKQSLNARKSKEAFQRQISEKREFQEMQRQAKQIAAEERRQNQLLQKTKKVNIEDVRKRFDRIDNQIRENAQKVLKKKDEACRLVMMKKEHRQIITCMATNQHQRAVRYRKHDRLEQHKVDLEVEVEKDNTYFASEEHYDL